MKIAKFAETFGCGRKAGDRGHPNLGEHPGVYLGVRSLFHRRCAVRLVRVASTPDGASAVVVMAVWFYGE